MSLTIFGSLRALDTPRFRAELYRAWSTASSGGLSHQAALEGLPPFRDADAEAARRALIVGTSQKKTVSVVVKTHPTLFSPLESALLVASEEGDRLGATLALLGDWFSRESKRHVRVRLLLGYPIFFGVIGSFVAPVPILLKSGRNAYLGAIGATLVAFFLLGGIVLDVLARAELTRRAVTMIRFARALAMCVSAGVPRGKAVRLAVEASESAELQRHIASRSDRDLQTMPLATLFEGCRAVPGALMGQMGVADATGDYLHTMRRYAEMAEEEEAPR